jgi:S1-C subfamily serine protease
VIAAGARPCPECGALNREAALFCASCGAALAEEVEPSPASSERRRIPAKAGGALSTALLAVVALGAAVLVQRAEIRSTERELAAIAERLDAVDGSLRALDGDLAELRKRVGAAEERSQGTGPLAARVLPSVYSLEVPDGSAAGFAAWRDGGATILLTAAHVVSGWEKVTVHRGERSWTGEVLEVDSTNDLATVRVRGRIGEPLWPEPARALPKPGATLVLFGSPLGYEGTVTRGIVSRVAYNEIQTDAPANPGSSGGPALTEDGRLVGVVVSGYEGRDITFVVPVRRVCVKLRRC